MSRPSTPLPVDPGACPEPSCLTDNRRISSDPELVPSRDHSESSLSSQSNSPPVSPRLHSKNSSIPSPVATLSLPTHMGVPTQDESQYPSEFLGNRSEKSSTVDSISQPCSTPRHSRNSFMPPPTRSLTICPIVSSPLAPAKAPKRNKSTMLTAEIEKPWLKEKNGHVRIAYLLTYATAAIGIIGAALRCYFGWKDVPRMGNLCLVMEDEFDTFNTDIWSHDVELSGFGFVIC